MNKNLKKRDFLTEKPCRKMDIKRYQHALANLYEQTQNSQSSLYIHREKEIYLKDRQ